MSRAFIERARGPHRESGMTRVMHAWGRSVATSDRGVIVSGLPATWTEQIFNIEPDFRWMRQSRFLAATEQYGTQVLLKCLQTAGTKRGILFKMLRSPAFGLADLMARMGVRSMFRTLDFPKDNFIYHYPLPCTHFDNLPGNCIPVVNLYDIMPIVFRDTYSYRDRRVFLQTINSIKRNRAHVIVNSSDTKHSLVCFFAIEASRIHVVPLGCDLPPAPANQRSLVPERPYLLYVASSVQRRKNVAVSIRGFANFLETTGLSADLVVVGPGTEAFQVFGNQELASLQGKVHCVGEINESSLTELYRSAKVGLYLSLYEGFGLPILECMQHRIPMVCADRTSLPEVAGGAALLVDPLDPASIGAGIARVWSDEQLRNHLVERGTRRASDFSWSSSFSALTSVYENIFEFERTRS